MRKDFFYFTHESGINKKIFSCKQFLFIELKYFQHNMEKLHKMCPQEN